MIPRIAITMGEPAGIGPEIIIKLAHRLKQAELIIFGDKNILNETANRLNRPLLVTECDFTQPPSIHQPGEIIFFPIDCSMQPTPGKASVDSVPYVLNCLDAAIEACLSKHCDALVTGPVHKGIINEAGISFCGHTEYLAEKSGVDDVVMFFLANPLRVALMTTHLPLKKVSEAITKERCVSTLRTVNQALQEQFKINNPVIAICGLNPHAGENGYLGDEEIKILNPCINKLQREGMSLIGPLPADTLFTPQNLEKYDAIIAMYHDQALPVIKHLGFGHAVNITLGLPFIRASVDHGTALDIAGKGIADENSLEHAVDTAITMVQEHA